ncbi:4-alpha-glucanotransferase [Streptomyces sp. NPDC002248]
MALARLAALHGVATSYAQGPEQTVDVPRSAVVAALAALGVDAATPESAAAALAAAEAERERRVLPPTVVVWSPPDAAEGPVAPPQALAGLPAGTRCSARTEDGGVTEWTAAPGEAVPALPLGVHGLQVLTPDGRAAQVHLVVAPDHAPAPAGRATGLLVQLYSLLSARSWGMGDLADLGALAGWAARTHDLGFVQVNPLHAAVPGEPTDPSPYRPSSRRFPDPVHLRVEDVPEYAYLDAAARVRTAPLLDAAAGLRHAVLREDALIDRDAVWALKRPALAEVCAVPLDPGRAAARESYYAEHGEALDDHATWCALVDTYGPERAAWPDGLQDPRSAATARARGDLAARVAFHRHLAWLTEEQLRAAQRTAREAGMPVGLVHDLAVGVHPEGSDAWAQRDVFAGGISVGAPPDAFNARGQDWGLPPWRPDRLAASGYAPYRALLRALFGYAGAVRIDHVMGLFRLWWIPAGEEPTAGTYVRYDAEAMLAVLCLEAHRAGSLVIGEDLGTVEPGVRDALARRGILGTSVLWFERDWEDGARPLAPEEWRPGALATATTHDLPPTAARFTGDDVVLRERLGLLSGPYEEERTRAEADLREWLDRLGALRLLPEGPEDEEGVIRAVHRFLLRTPAALTGIWLPDTVGDRRPQNLPGTWTEYPNWRLPLADAKARALSLEELTASQRVAEFFAGLRDGVGEPGER